jgi:hypothetical protein
MSNERAARGNGRPEETGANRGSLAPTEAGYAQEPTDLELSLQQAEARARLALRELMGLRHEARGAVSEDERANIRGKAVTAARHLMLAAESTLKASALAATRPRDAETSQG